MLCGEAVVAIWNDISKEGRAEFYDWHIREHIPERVGIPGFLRGRRYRAINSTTEPEFFTLYETETFQVLQGQDYAGRLNAPTPWTKSATSHFRNTSRGLARVLASAGEGSGGILATVRFRLSETQELEKRVALIDAIPGIARSALITGAHLCRSDDDASGLKTAESKERTDIQAPPNWFVMVEACTTSAVEREVDQFLARTHLPNAEIGIYTHEYTRLKTAYGVG